MYQLPLTGKAYSTDNKSIYHLLKSFLVNTSDWTWIEPYDTMENGHGAFLAWMSHYNGQGELSKQAQVSCLHGGAQLENRKYTKKCNVSAMYGCGG